MNNNQSKGIIEEFVEILNQAPITQEKTEALDNLTLDSLLLVISQFKTLNEYIKEYSNHLADERKAKKVLRPINEEMRKKIKHLKK